MPEQYPLELPVEAKDEIVTGIINPEKLLNHQTFPWFRGKFNVYEPDAVDTAYLKNMRKNLGFVVVAACGNSGSKEMLPAFFKVMDRAGISPNRITLCFLDPDKKPKEGLVLKYRVAAIPAIIVLYKKRPMMKIEGPVKASIETYIAERMREMKRFIIF